MHVSLLYLLAIWVVMKVLMSTNTCDMVLASAKLCAFARILMAGAVWLDLRVIHLHVFNVVCVFACVRMNVPINHIISM